MRRREFIAGFGSAAAWPLGVRAQQPGIPVIGVISPGSASDSVRGAFRKGLGETGYVEGQNVTVEYHWLEGEFDHIPALVTDLVRRRVTVIAAFAGAPAAKGATTTIPIVFGAGDDPVRLGLVASLARPGGNLTGMHFFAQEAVSKRLGLLHELAPKANRMAVLVNPQNTESAEGTLREVPAAARLIGLSIDVLRASTSREIEEAFATMARERIEALFISGDGSVGSRSLQLATLATRHRIAASFNTRAFAEVGGLMSYGPERILRGAKPADLPVVQSTKFELIINLRTAKAIGLTIPETLLAIADEVIQ